MTLLPSATWRALSEAHHQQVHALIGTYLGERSRGATHPVIDFLFTYYSLKPAQLLRWHPGFGYTLQDAAEYENLRGYRTTAGGVTASAQHLEHRRPTITYIADLMEATATRTPRFGCFGLHEWAMVYRGGTEAVRHSTVPLRLGHAETDAVVESLPLRCTHFDAFRFFTEPARPRNETHLSRDTQIDAEQPGCLHAGMDLYKFSAKLLPLVSTQLVWDAFTLAYAARELDMRASPYDLTAYGYDPVPIETAAGRADYIRQQQQLSQRATTIRTQLLEQCRALLAH
ncbi:3-methyladenine DNA glycosylase [Hoyosella rhizosphaerae]|uniref:3-methyladenine DNA glycosylase n=1 Tax=Hoyosella rhizosphaerae TaxID=1755582 RepID=A0A916TYG7_9ACTN|nr:3-methyladenine DNA glycosylase [Hoyosella rhizosphaerae]MBN4927288.1 3-methyladenine DNA glycosylase [Hoyosella rhizosphaerae]GGC52448.1 hypothetical protein GCM10011410_00980 [Hoyosella rhizosphaerae]